MTTDIEASQRFEMEKYISALRAMYEQSIKDGGKVYDLCSAVTDGFRSITSTAIATNPKILHILRYCVVPSISQMKLGQFLGVGSTQPFEARKLRSREAAPATDEIAKKAAAFINRNLDRSRFTWIEGRCNSAALELAQEYAKNWTCSLMADQSSQTKYRNWRKSTQELAIEKELTDRGYKLSSSKKDIGDIDDLEVGCYTRERKVLGGSSQKADLAVRSKASRRLILIEAKAVGVLLDAYKRVKECCDKARDWRGNAKLGRPLVAAVIAGFFSQINIETLGRSDVEVVWEHRLSDLGVML